MIKIGHKIDRKLLLETLKFIRGEYLDFAKDRSKQKRKRNEDFFIGHVEDALSLVRLGYVFGQPPARLVQILNRSLPEVVTFYDLGGTFDPILLRELLGAALLTKQKRILKWFAQLRLVDYKNNQIEISEAGYRLIQSYQTGALGDYDKFKITVVRFVAALKPAKLKISPKSEKEIYLPLAKLLQAIVAKDQSAFDAASKNQMMSWRKRFGRASERANWDGVLDFETLGIYRLAERSGLQPPDNNPYAPLKLLMAGGKHRS